ncbi:hypothetical protein A3D71_04355 [Candidatus Kaiserbacteria bacterium RIFCSPHIGHO2_02_FULL_55_20]|uniref:Uncharacterized protein n=1 Tax=Candidatus Kaiserbacteria bacterium RIFCSPHIGHO2_02_FULL_55_20 TaxID=1798497 RepID=A0A1F6DW42_9BACT|nr:MAG: hypothetical protein A2680_03775 [Candidatus Kaiserbacteria bacterium RIFCSPHIGHO2_01_FULL_55_37]OGG65252.1 MAG: hypothetical protein A3D71_04355 [Candidatus Kaiserbacteria bacterium RIFCSPHIGHO2_02_FULL_55_20]
MVENSDLNKTNKLRRFTSKAIEATSLIAFGAALANGPGGAPKSEPMQQGSAALASESIDHQLAEQAADTLVLKLHNTFRAGGPQAGKAAEAILLQYLETGTTSEVNQSVMRQVPLSLERQQAVKRLGEAILALSRVKGRGEQVDAAVTAILSRVAHEFTEGAKELTGRLPNKSSPFLPDTSTGGFGSNGGDFFGDEEGPKDPNELHDAGYRKDVGAETGDVVQVTDRITQTLEDNGPLKGATGAFLNKLSTTFRKVLPEKLAGSPKDEVTRAETEYLNTFAAERGLSPDGRTSAGDVDAFDFAREMELRQDKPDTRVLDYLLKRILDEIARDKDERERLQKNKPRDVQEREA